MTVFTFSKPHCEDLQTPIFESGPGESGDAAMLFTKSELAKDFRSNAGWNDEEHVVELTPIPLLQWLLELKQDGTNYLVVNPSPQAYADGRPLPTIKIETRLRELTAQLIQQFDATPQNHRTVRVKIFHCRSCGQTVEQRLGNITPVCCGEKMDPVAKDSIEPPE